MRKTILILYIMLASHEIQAYTITEANSFAESDSVENTKCQLSSSASTATIESVLRQNRIQINDKDSRYHFYSATTAIDVGDYCAAFTELSVYFNDLVTLPLSKKKKTFAQVQLCNFGSILTGQKHNLQTRVNETLRSYAEQCISKIEKDF